MKQISFPKETTFREVELPQNVEQDSVKTSNSHWLLLERQKFRSVVCSLDPSMKILLLFSSPSILIDQISWECLL